MAETPGTVPHTEAPEKPQSHLFWTVLIYLAGDNNLSEECVYALKEIKKVGTSLPSTAGRERKLNVIVQFDPLGRGNPSRRFIITDAGGDGELECDEDKEVQKLETDTSDPEALLSFLCESIHAFPSDYYMVILGGHGAGVIEGFFLQDEERPLSSIPSSFPIPMLKSVFQSDRLEEALGGRKINIVGFDACMMSMVEVCYELRGIAALDLVVASEGFTLNSGWPIDRIIAAILNDSDVEPEPLAKFIVDEYVTFYHDFYLGGLSVDQAIIRLNRIEDLKTEIDALAAAMIRRLEEIPERDRHYAEEGEPFQDSILLAHWAAQSYNGEQCVDLYDFCSLLQKRADDFENPKDPQSIFKCCERVMKVIEDLLIVRTCFSGAAFEHSHGASIYFPWGEFDFSPTYRQLDFAKYSEWYKFLKTYLRATKRGPRKEVKETFRSTPPTSKGPQGKIHSMRNPPTEFPLSECLQSQSHFLKDPRDCKRPSMRSAGQRQLMPAAAKPSRAPSSKKLAKARSK